ncbi:MAG: replicative DNA helicase [Clostridia bacterium]|nr:replicative DNA helicase [Clostridia bacterium]
MKKDTNKESFKTMPHSIEAEQSVLGCLLIDNEVPINVISTLKKEDFYSPANKIIYEKMTELYRNNKPIDFVTLTDLLEKTGELDAVGGIDYITLLTNAVPSAVNYKHYVDLVRRDSLLRVLINSGQKIVENAYSALSSEDSLKFAEKLVFDIAETQDFSTLEHIDGAIKDVIDKFNKIAKDPSSLRGLKTGFDDLDYITNGLQKSDLILLAARPGVGKSSLAMNIINYAAIEGRKNCAIFSLEMPKVQIAQRSVCSIAGISMEKALKGKLSIEEWAAAIKASKKLSEANIFIDDSSVNKPIDILSKCRRLKREKGLDLVMVDYLQLMNSDNNKYDNKQLEVAEITRTLKIAARELDVPIILLSQLSRAVETRKGDHRPVLSDLRDSGAIEQDADIVMFIYKADMYNDVVSEDEPGMAEVIIAKHRNGSLGTVKLRWEGVTTSFFNAKGYRPKPQIVSTTPEGVIKTEAVLDENSLEEAKALFDTDPNK